MNSVNFASFGGYKPQVFQSAAQQSQETTDTKPSRGERLVNRFDKDDDGKISLSEMQGTKLGKRMSVDRFARLDKDGDNALSSEELTRKGQGRGPVQNPGAAMSAYLNKVADFLASKVPETSEAEQLTEKLFQRLDTDQSGGLNSEEIAGTQLAEKIGSDFYELDEDKSGTLDAAELKEFIEEEILGLADPVEASDDVEVDDGDDDGDHVATAQTSTVKPVEGPAEAAVPKVEAVEPVVEELPTEAVAPNDALPQPTSLNAFETALKLLQDSQENQEAYGTLSTFYESMKSIVNA